jgi:hypothetical protein
VSVCRESVIRTLSEVCLDALVGALVVLQDTLAAAIADKDVGALLDCKLDKAEVSATVCQLFAAWDNSPSSLV